MHISNEAAQINYYLLNNSLVVSFCCCCFFLGGLCRNCLLYKSSYKISKQTLALKLGFAFSIIITIIVFDLCFSFLLVHLLLFQLAALLTMYACVCMHVFSFCFWINVVVNNNQIAVILIWTNCESVRDCCCRTIEVACCCCSFHQDVDAAATCQRTDVAVPHLET